MNVGSSGVQPGVQNTSFPISLKKEGASDGSSDTSDLSPNNQEAVYCEPCALPPFGIITDPATEFDANVMKLLELQYTLDIQEISNVLTAAGGSVETAEAILQAQYAVHSPVSSDNCNQSDYCDWRSETPDGSLEGLPDLVSPDMAKTGENGFHSNFNTYIVEDYPLTSSYMKFEYWEIHECERFLRSELWKIADVNLKWMHPLWSLHQVFSFLLVPAPHGFQPEFFDNPMSMAEKRAREDWIQLVSYPFPQFTPIDMPRTERIDMPLELRGYFEGPANSAYAGGKFKMRILLPRNFPHKPPLVYFDTPIFHPSYDHDGEFLMDASMWKPSFSLRDVLGHVATLLQAEEGTPLKIEFSNANVDISNMWKSNSERFNLLAATWTQQLAS